MFPDASGLGYFEKYNPSTAQLGFSQGQFEILNSSAAMRNMSSIWLPSAAVEQSPGKIGPEEWTGKLLLANGNKQKIRKVSYENVLS